MEVQTVQGNEAWWLEEAKCPPGDFQEGILIGL